jgi:hypothetical protein
MKKTLQSYSSASTIGATSKNFLVPSWSQLVLYLLISILLLIIFNLGGLWSYLNSVILAPEGGLDSVLAEHASGVRHFLNAASQSIILQIIFWVCIGSLIYVLIWFIRNVVVNILNDVVADQYIHPPSYSRFNYWGSVIARKVFFAISTLVLLFYFFASWRLVSSFAALARKLVTQPITSHSVAELIGIALVIMAVLHTLILIIHIVTNSWRFIYRDL